MSAKPFTASLHSDRRRFLTGLICCLSLVIGFVSVVVSTSGCRPKIQTKIVTEQQADKRCEESLDSSFSMLQPDRLGISSDGKTVAGLLNQWNQGCGSEITDWARAPLPEALIKTLPGQDVLKFTESEIYEIRDAEQIRDALLSQQVNRYALSDETSDLERVLTLFRYVVRNIEMQPAVEAVSGRPYEVLMLGQGQPEDRAWVFAELLREIKIDSCLIRPKETKNPLAWLMGVAVEQKLYLFDCWLGIPVLTASGTPATLQDVRKDGELLQTLGSEAEPYPLTSEHLKNLQLELIGNSSLWAPRMQKLSTVLTGDRSVQIHTSLEDTAEMPGQISRVLAAADGFVAKDNVGLWTYPEQQILNTSSRAAEDSRRFEENWKVLQAPYQREFNRQTQVVVFGKESRILLSGRLAQLTGDYLAAIRMYQMVRLQCTFPTGAVLPPEMRKLHAIAREDAAFWIAITQLEMGDIEAAGNSLSAYLRTYENPRHGTTAKHFLTYTRLVRMFPKSLW